MDGAHPMSDFDHTTAFAWLGCDSDNVRQPDNHRRVAAFEMQFDKHPALPFKLVLALEKL